MKSLLLSCKKFETEIKKLATRPITVNPEPVTQKKFEAGKSIVALITVEKGDNTQETSKNLSLEIEKFSKDTGIKEIVICPFGHLSNNLASSEDTILFLDTIEKELDNFNTLRIHFGSHKTLSLDIHGHQGNVRFREF